MQWQMVEMRADSQPSSAGVLQGSKCRLIDASQSPASVFVSQSTDDPQLAIIELDPGRDGPSARSPRHA